MKESCPVQGDLLAYLDGASVPTIAQHLATCSDCAARLDRYRRTMYELSTTLYRVHCPPPEHLSLYQLDLLDEKEQLVTAQHVRQCLHCQRELASLSQVDEPALAELLTRFGDKVQAVLEGQWMPRPAVVTARGPEALRRYQVRDLDIILRSRPADDREKLWNLLGRAVHEAQVPASLPGSTVWLGDAGGAKVVEATIDDLGYFEFRDLPADTYALSFLWDDTAVLVREVTVP